MVQSVNRKFGEGEGEGVAGVALLHKTFALLDHFTLERPNWTQAELTAESKLPRSTVSRVARYLVQRGYLSFDPANRVYALGYAAADLGRRAAHALDLAILARDILDHISRETRETVMLTRYDPAIPAVVCIAQVHSLHEGLQVFEKIGARFPLHAGASAKAVLAFLPEAQRRAVLAGPLAPLANGKPIDPEALAAEIDEIRARGYAATSEETYPGASGLGIALIGPGGQPEGSLAVAGPLYRMTPEAKARIAELLVEASRTIRHRLSAPRENATK